MIFVPTPNDVVDTMLKMAAVTKKDTVYDLGCGDGRIVITAAQKYGARGVGIDIDPDRVHEATDNVRKAGVTDRVKIIRGDLFEADISEATVVTLYLLTELNLKLRPKLLRDLQSRHARRVARLRHGRLEARAHGGGLGHDGLPVAHPAAPGVIWGSAAASTGSSDGLSLERPRRLDRVKGRE